MRTTLIHPEVLPDVWARIEHLMGDAAARSDGKYLATDILQRAINGKFNIWTVTELDDFGNVILHGLAVTELVNYPRKKICHLVATTGEDLDALLPSLTEIEAWAVKEGCGALEPIARPGYERVLRDRGYTKTHVVLSKELPRA